MKIGNNISLPISEYNFNNNKSNTVYYYLTITKSISLSYFFENNEGLIDFSVNDFNIDDYIITNISGMFSGCSRLQHVNFIPFTGKNIIDISNLFKGCNFLSSLNLSTLEPRSIEKLDSLFYDCKSLLELELPNFNI